MLCPLIIVEPPEGMVIILFLKCCFESCISDFRTSIVKGVPKTLAFGNLWT